MLQAVPLDVAADEENATIAPRSFVAQVFTRAKIRVVNSAGPHKVYGESRSGRSQIEAITEPLHRGVRVQLRIKVFDLANGRAMPGTRQQLGKRIEKRVSAMVAADPEAVARSLGGGAKLAELRTELDALTLDNARTLGRRLQSMVSAGERAG
jgi:hypothetical protein